MYNTYSYEYIGIYIYTHIYIYIERERDTYFSACRAGLCKGGVSPLFA